MKTRGKLSRYDRLMATARHSEYISDYNHILSTNTLNTQTLHWAYVKLCDKWNLPFPVEPYEKEKKLQKDLWKMPAVMEVTRNAGPKGNPVSTGKDVNALSPVYLQNELEKEKDYDRFTDCFYVHLRIDSTKNIKHEIWPQTKRIISKILSGIESKPGRKLSADIWIAYDQYGKDEISRSKLSIKMAGITGKARHDPKYKNQWNKIDRAVKRADSIINSLVPNGENPLYKVFHGKGKPVVI